MRAYSLAWQQAPSCFPVLPDELLAPLLARIDQTTLSEIHDDVDSSVEYLPVVTRRRTDLLFHFLRLPPEIRSRLYFLVFSALALSWRLVEFTNDVALVRTCRQIRSGIHLLLFRYARYHMRRIDGTHTAGMRTKLRH